MAVYEYWWGTERPQLQEARHQRMVDVFGQAARARLQAQFDAGMAEIDRITTASNQRVGMIRMSLVGGRYNREVANAVAAQHGLLGSTDPVKRGRGRPRKYGPDDTRPARPSRAKTDAGRLRALSKEFLKRGPRNAEARRNSGTVSPVTASPARAVAPKAASKIGRALLSGTIAAQQEVVAPVEVEIIVTDGAIASEVPEDSAAPRLNFAEIAAVHEASFKRASEELSSAEMSEDGVLLLSNLLHSHRVQNHEVPQWERGQDGAPMLPYDFSDAMDESKAPSEVRSLFGGFGLSRHSPSTEMTELEMRAWVEGVIFNDVYSPKADFDRYFRESGSCLGIYRRLKRSLEPQIQRERSRVLVWPTIERRVVFVERMNQLLVNGHIDRDTALVRVARLDFDNLDLLFTSTHDVYREIVDAMTWFDGFSRLDIAKWSGHDPSKIPLCKVKEGFPGWTYPKRLHEAVFNGHIFEEPAEFDYEAPSVADLVQFASGDTELMIANLRERGGDYHKIDL